MFGFHSLDYADLSHQSACLKSLHRTCCHLMVSTLIYSRVSGSPQAWPEPSRARRSLPVWLVPSPLPACSLPRSPTHGSGYFFHISLAGSVWYTVFCFPSKLGLLGLLCTILAHSICSSHEPDST